MNKIRAPKVYSPYGYQNPGGLGPRHNTREAQGPDVKGNGNDRMVIGPNRPGRSHAGYRKLPNI